MVKTDCNDSKTIKCSTYGSENGPIGPYNMAHSNIEHMIWTIMNRTYDMDRMLWTEIV